MKLNKLELSILLAAATAAIATCPAKANIGETKDVAIQRWGQPTMNGVYYEYHWHDWLITELYNEADRAIVTVFDTQKGPIPYKIVRSLDYFNLPAGFNSNGDDCVELKMAKPQEVRAWSSKDGQFYIEAGSTYRLYATREGHLANQLANQANQNKPKVSAEEDSKTLA